MEQCRILLGFEERAMLDDVDALAAPCADELPVDELRLPEACRCEVGVAADRVDDIVQIERA